MSKYLNYAYILLLIHIFLNSFKPCFTFAVKNKPQTTCLLDLVPTKLMKELLPIAEEPHLNIINSALHPKTIQAGGF